MPLVFCGRDSKVLLNTASPVGTEHERWVFCLARRTCKVLLKYRRCSWQPSARVSHKHFSREETSGVNSLAEMTFRRIP